MRGTGRQYPEPELDVVFRALEDRLCREIVTELDEPMTVAELSETCDIPLSTTYRKIDRLDEASLVTERTEIRRGGHHRSLYQVNFVTLVVPSRRGSARTGDRTAAVEPAGGTRLALVGATEGDVSVLVPTLVVALKTLTLVFGGLITYFAYSAYHRTRTPALRALAIGFGTVTLGAFLAGAAHQAFGLDTERSSSSRAF